MADKKFVVLLIITIILALTLLFFLVAKPQFNKYVEEKNIQTAKEVVSGIIQITKQQGYVQLQFENETIILVEYIPNE